MLGANPAECCCGAVQAADNAEYSCACKSGDSVLAVCSANRVVKVDHVTVIGERLNPTGKKRLKQALIDEDYDYILTQAGLVM